MPERWTAAAAALGDAFERRFEAEGEQLPLFLPIGLGLGIAAWFWLADSNGWIAFMLGAGSLASGLLALGWGRRWGRALSIFFLAAIVGCGLVWARALWVAAPVVRHQGIGQISAVIEDFEQLPARSAVRLKLRPVGAPAMPPLLRINVDSDKAPPGLVPGATVALRAYLMPPPPMAVPGAYDFAQTAWFDRIGGTGKALGPVTVTEPARTPGWKGWLSALRERLAAHILAKLPGPEGGIASAFATGDMGGIPESDNNAMRRSGLAHLLSISGLHVAAVVAAAMFLTLKLLALSPRLALRWPLVTIAAGAGALAGLAYTLLTGSQIPTVRSCAAALLVLAGLALGREAITLRLVAVGALAVLLFWPEQLAGPSFQLSFAAVTALIALHDDPRMKAFFARREEPRLFRLGRGIASLFLTGVAVEVALSPIAVYHFHRAGLYGAFANIVAIPLTTFVTMPAEGLALLFDLVGLGGPFWWAAGMSLRFLLWIAHTVAEAPGAVTMLPTMPTAAFAVIACGGIWIALWRTRWRWWGLVPVAVGAAWSLSVPAPDLIVTGDGRHLALRTPSGELATLRGRAGDYVRHMLSESAGSADDLLDLDDANGAACTRDACVADIVKDGRSWRVLATRSGYRLPWNDLIRACAAADIVISDRRLPPGCAPKWLKADRPFLRRSGGLSIAFGMPPRVETVADRVGNHPWAAPR